jgi:hypothetical protein
MNPTAAPRAQPRDLLLGRMASTMVEFLVHEFEEILLERSDHAAGERACPLGQSAEAAHRITALCQRLRTQLERYERFAHMCREAEADREDDPGTHDLPF